MVMAAMSMRNRRRTMPLLLSMILIGRGYGTGSKSAVWSRMLLMPPDPLSRFGKRLKIGADASLQ
jgi:hypothetical protein